MLIQWQFLHYDTLSSNKYSLISWPKDSLLNGPVMQKASPCHDVNMRRKLYFRFSPATVHPPIYLNTRRNYIYSNDDLELLEVNAPW